MTCTNAEVAELHDVVFFKRHNENETFACKGWKVQKVQKAEKESMIKCQFEGFLSGHGFFFKFYKTKVGL